MFTKKYILIVDAEGMKGKKPYNIGLVVYNRTDGIKLKIDFYLVDCMTENQLLSVNKYTATAYGKNIDRYRYSEDEEIERTVSKRATKIILDVIQKYNIKEVWAYCKSFDFAAFQALFDDYYSNPITNGLEWYDIQQAILYTKLLTKKYVAFCVRNNYLTSNNNISTTVQTVYRYLKDNTYQEAHNGLDDALKELEILTIAMKSGRFHWRTNKQPYKELEKFCKSFDPHLKPY